MDVEIEPEASKLIEYVSHNGKQPKLPLVLFGNGDRLEQPSNLEVAEKNWVTNPSRKTFL